MEVSISLRLRHESVKFPSAEAMIPRSPSRVSLQMGSAISCGNASINSVVGLYHSCAIFLPGFLPLVVNSTTTQTREFAHWALNIGARFGRFLHGANCGVDFGFFELIKSQNALKKAAFLKPKMTKITPPFAKPNVLNIAFKTG